MAEVRSTKPSSPCSTSSSSSFTWKTGEGGGEDVAGAVRLVTGSGFVSGEYMGRGMP